MAEMWEPLAKKAEPPFRTILPEGAVCFDDIVDPEYCEADDAVQMCDVYRWIKEEFPRVVSDRPAGTIVDYRMFRASPPIAIACNILETWAARPVGQRTGLYMELRRCLASAAVKAPEDSEEVVDTSEADAYLAELEERERLAAVEGA